MMNRFFKKNSAGSGKEPEVGYSLAGLMRIADSGGEVTIVPNGGGSEPCRVRVYHDVSGKKWRMTIQLEPEKWWFLSVFFHDTGAFHMFSLDYEDEHDAHYEFRDEQRVRQALYRAGDEKLYLHEVFIRYIRENGGGRSGGFALLKKIPFTSSIHY